MNIDFNNVRRQAIAAYSGLVQTIKGRMDESHRVELQRFEIEDDMENLRSALVGIALTHVEGNDDFQDVLGDAIVPSLCEDEDA